MKRRLTNQQRQAIQKIATLLLSVVMFASAIFAIPHLVKAMPVISSPKTKKFLLNDSAFPQTIPAFALGNDHLPQTEEISSDISEEISESPTVSQPETPPQTPSLTPNPGDLFVTESNLCWYKTGETPTLNIIDRTSYDVDLNDYIQKDFPVEYEITEQPLVLIIHTHGSESYLPNGCDFYAPEESFRSDDESKTVVHIGEILCEKLNAMGIPAIQDKTMHDIPEYNDSYNNSLAAIKEYLVKYPSIRFVIDLHRDSVFDSMGNNLKPLTTINDKPTAQLMLVMGTNQMGIPHPNWRENLTFATYLQQEMNVMFPTLARPINLRTAEFNQALTKGSIILEVGSCGNTVEEAENAIDLFAQTYAELLLKYSK